MELYHYISSQKRENESFEKCIIRLLKAFPVSDFEKIIDDLIDDLSKFYEEKS